MHFAHHLKQISTWPQPNYILTINVIADDDVTSPGGHSDIGVHMHGKKKKKTTWKGIFFAVYDEMHSY